LRCRNLCLHGQRKADPRLRRGNHPPGYEKAQKRLESIINDKSKSGKAVYHEQNRLKEVKAELYRLRLESDELIERAVLDAWRVEYAALLKQAAKEQQNKMQPFLSRPDPRKIKILTDNMRDDFNAATSTVARRINDQIRQAGLSNVAEKYISRDVLKTTQKRLEDDLTKLDEVLHPEKPSPDTVNQQEELQRVGVKYRNGRIVPLDTYAAMAAKTGLNEVANTARIDACKEFGYDLVRFTTHTPTCRVCSMYELRAFALTEEAANGKYKGPDGEPLYFPLLSETAFKSGYNTIHPNCEHILVWIVASAHTAQELKDMADLSNRPYEDDRGRKEKEAYAAAQEKNRKRNADLREWQRLKQILPKDTPAFGNFRQMKEKNSQRYQDLKADERYLRKQGVKNLNPELISTRVRSIINGEPVKITDKTISELQLPIGVDSRALEPAQNLLTMMKDKDIEQEGYIFTNPDFEEIGRGLGGNYGAEGIKGPDGEYYLFHNHPVGETFSPEDVESFVLNADMKGIIAVGNNGRSYILEKTSEYNASGFIGLYNHSKSVSPNYSRDDPEAVISFIEEVLSNAQRYGIRYVG
jgi:hypothetical protein